MVSPQGAANAAGSRWSGRQRSTMSSQFTVLTELTVTIGAAAVAALVFQLLRLPIVLGYILAGLIVGPHVSGAVTNLDLVETLSDLGVILLFFMIGLEFSIRTIARVGLPTLLTVIAEQALIILIVFATGRALGWTSTEAVFVAIGVAVASTMLVVKGLEEHKVTGPAAELILAMMVVEDLMSILLLAVMTGVATGANMSPGELAVTVAELGGFFVAMVVIGLLIVPRLIRAIARFKRSEPLLVASIAVCFGMVWVAVRAGYSIALGAFVGGMLIAESGKGHDVDALVRPLRDIFAAIFFVSIGMIIQPAQVVDNWWAAILVAVVLVVGKTFGVTISAFLTGNSLRRAVQAGLSLSQIGEFAFIVVAVGIAHGAIREELLPIVVGASCLTAISGSWQIKSSGRFASWLDARIPKPIATFVTFYESWIARLRTEQRPDTIWRRLRGPAIVLVVDASLLGALVIGTAAAHRSVVEWLTTTTGVEPRIALVVLVLVAGAFAGTFAIAIARNAVKVARLLATVMIPHGHAELDLGRAPRKALVITLELAIVLVIGVPLAAITQPFVPGGGVVVLAVIVILALAASRSITDFDSHVRAGSALIVEVLARQGNHEQHAPSLPDLLPGIGEVTPITLAPEAPAIGKSLAELDLRARTGASVLAITRGSDGMANPSPKEPLHAGDVLALAGSRDAIAAARELLLGKPDSSGMTSLSA